MNVGFLFSFSLPILKTIFFLLMQARHRFLQFYSDVNIIWYLYPIKPRTIIPNPQFISPFGFVNPCNFPLQNGLDCVYPVQYFRGAFPCFSCYGPVRHENPSSFPTYIFEGSFWSSLVPKYVTSVAHFTSWLCNLMYYIDLG